MAINYPTSLDSFTNPTSTDPTDSPSHSLQHANANDALEAIETKLGIGASPAGSAVAGYVLTASTGGTTTWAEPYTGESITVGSAGTAAYTLATGDEGKLLQFNGTFTVTVPADSTFDFADGTIINILNIGSGTITTAGAGGVTLNGNPGLKLNGQWSGATFVKRASDTWVIVGDLSA
jgi:hypothetical protein